jgi:uncharacterized protein involved in exopolysaccharide biosynthesis
MAGELQTPNESPLDVRDLLFRAKRYGWLLIFPLVACLCGASIYLKVADPVYESHVVVALADRAGVSDAIASLVRPDRSGESPAARAGLVNNKIHSRQFLEELARRVGMLKDPDLVERANNEARRYRGLTGPELAVRIASVELAKRIRSVPVEASFVRITVSDKAPEEARRTASLIADMLIEETRRTSLERVQARGEFSQDQITVYEERLRKSEEALQRYQESLLNRTISAPTLDASKMDDANRFIQDTDQEIEQIRARLDTEKNEWVATMGGDSPLPDLTGGRAVDLERRLNDLEGRHVLAVLRGEGGPGETVESIQGSIASLRQSLFTEYEARADQELAQAPEFARSAVAGIALDRTVLRTLRSKRQKIQGMVAEFTRGVQRAPREEMELARLEGEVETNRDLLNNLRREATSARRAEALETSELGLKLSVMEPPQLPIQPAAPDPKKIYGAAAMLGILLTSAVVLAGEKIAHVLRTVEQAEQEMGTRVLGTVPRIEGWSRPGSFLQNHWAGLSVVLVLVLTGAFYVVNATLLSDRHENPPTSQTGRR